MHIQSLKPNPITLKILATTIFNLVCFINIGLYLATVPVFVHKHLGYNTVIAGMAISIAYLSTFSTRPIAGRWLDTKGAKSSVIIGLCVNAIGGVLTLLASLYTHLYLLSLFILILGRFCMGASESWTSTGTNVWNIGRVGIENSTKIISWNGVTSYGGMAIGTPLGSYLYSLSGFWGGMNTIAILTIILASFSALLASTYPAIIPHSNTKRLSFSSVFLRVLPSGSCLGLATIGFGSVQAFIALYFIFHHWNGSAIALSIFGVCFVIVRFIFKNAIARFGGYMVSTISMLVETFGLYMIASGISPTTTYIGAALTGCGFSLLYPALGVIAISKVGAENRGAALAAFSLFLDIALFISGPLLGAVQENWGYFALFIFASSSTLLGAICTYILHYQTKYRN